MAHWGVAYALGPFYNLAWRELGEREAAAAIGLAHDHIGRARALAADATGLENRLVEALASRFQQPHPVSPEEYDRWDDDYAAEMRRVHYDYPDDDASRRCSPKPSLPVPRADCGMSKPGGRPAAQMWSRRLASANGRSRGPTWPGGRSIRR